MSNKRNPKRRVPLKVPTHYILTEENKEHFAQQLGYPLAYCEQMLAEALEQGYTQVRFPIPPRG